ncbi:MAG: hypothetical protein E6845_01285 [Clostridium sp.]|uniref:hypothetical protein n=1 Tax=Clostridium sp. TaxID=1506 RepID=UPI002904BE89|nr:hypothetical protein [Clostridium sp.]MDU1601567.1 hypothetical protein [Clostridium sp.]
MKFNLKKSKLLFEVRYKNKDYNDVYTYEMLYRRNDGKYFINDINLKVWKESSLELYKNNPIEYMVIDWEKEEEEAILDEIKLNDEYIMAMGKLSESELPF